MVASTAEGRQGFAALPASLVLPVFGIATS